MGFCLEDSFCPPGTDGKFNCAWQGVTSGCGDLYGDNLACQWIDVTDYVLSRSFDPEAELTLTVRVNSDRRFPEEDYDNNVAEARFRMSELERRATDTWSKPRHGPVPPGCRALDAQGRP
ncbi:hypothetical protein DFJ74DRAFT_675367 [Hyaloraphidium curvatum]|nr:hypothetical protein DFJ74DRAFT_675367 [Hyaloraphidium curvatum]